MGISGLLPFVKKASKTCHLSEFKKKTVAIDAYCWLHKGAIACASKLALGEKTDVHILYCLKYLDMITSFQIKPILVFDGRYLPAKAHTEKKRKESRDNARKRAAECLRLGKVQEAYSNFKKCVDISPEMALALIKECRKRRIDFIVAPYEADAQLAFLNRANLADIVISEDSDLLAFGCSKVIFKLDLAGTGTLVEADKLYLTVGERPEAFNFDKFRYMCILSGCDYLDSLPGIGLKKAQKFFRTTCIVDVYEALSKIPSKLNMVNLVVNDEYKQNFMIADATFRHQLVYDPVNRRLQHLTDPDLCNSAPSHLCNVGMMLDQAVAFQIAIGNVNPLTLQQMDHWSVDEALRSYVNPSTSIWSTMCSTAFQVKSTHVEVKFQCTKRKTLICDVKDLVNSEETKRGFDEKLKKDLSVYLMPPLKKHCSSSEKAINITSPVLSGRKSRINPFVKSSLRPRNLGGLTQTILDENVCVRSRFFSNPSVNHTPVPNSTKSELVIFIEDNVCSEGCEKSKENRNNSVSSSEVQLRTCMTEPVSNNVHVLDQNVPLKANNFMNMTQIKIPNQKKLRQPTLLSMFGK